MLTDWASASTEVARFVADNEPAHPRHQAAD
ncbi:hypothetical protein SACE_3719 [Saccharopolyspora erythraea NRRL 2338]|uniref:Uncharacterized protein n=1 Tax=Saccharopolyspora erythraea (strain ATCC 11635 / DSM 40517 / JCM 4748 / NBRC 13426 / NCIMB 8594 / NRRL 2338) TaxID=405948 RepID=A4FG16_SACEN|nr:hypothetical protein N599_14660 [Saccharopolyspora erythraea D]CAM02991.1 hypothetical protein SACE_3719 [Saccharopolyspora erythraea NRRL 2338]